jgi:hypothetical protein
LSKDFARLASPIERWQKRPSPVATLADLNYSACLGHAERSARRPKKAKLALNAALRTYVQERLAGTVVAPSGVPVPGPSVSWKGRRRGRRQSRRWAHAWSPEQIARRLPLDFPDDETMRISHEAIYQALFVQGRGALRRELTACLRTGRALRMPRERASSRQGLFIFCDHGQPAVTGRYGPPYSFETIWLTCVVKDVVTDVFNEAFDAARDFERG